MFDMKVFLCTANERLGTLDESDTVVRHHVRY